MQILKIYFSGTITSEIVPPSSGSAIGGYITYDGLINGSYNAISERDVGQALVQMPATSNQYGFALWKSLYGKGNGKDYIVIQDFEISGTSHAIYVASGCDHVIIRRNYIPKQLGNAGFSKPLSSFFCVMKSLNRLAIHATSCLE